MLFASYFQKVAQMTQGLGDYFWDHGMFSTKDALKARKENPNYMWTLSRSGNLSMRGPLTEERKYVQLLFAKQFSSYLRISPSMWSLNEIVPMDSQKNAFKQCDLVLKENEDISMAICLSILGHEDSNEHILECKQMTESGFVQRALFVQVRRDRFESGAIRFELNIIGCIAEEPLFQKATIKTGQARTENAEIAGICINMQYLFKSLIPAICGY